MANCTNLLGWGAAAGILTYDPYNGQLLQQQGAQAMRMHLPVAPLVEPKFDQELLLLDDE